MTWWQDVTNRISENAYMLPFVGMVMKKDMQQHQPIITRLLESAVLGAIVLYGVVKVVETDITWIKRDLVEVKTDIREIRRMLRND